MAKIPVGVQLYSIRDDCKKDLAAAMAAVAKLGYHGVEYAGYYGKSGKELRKIQDGLGLKCCGTHTGMDTLLGDNFMKTVEFNKELGNPYLIVPWLPPEQRKTLAVWKETAMKFNELAAKAKAVGMRVGYHNHHEEFHAVEGEVLWEALYKNTTPDVIMQFDTGNARIGGADPLPFLQRHKGRSVTVHLKPWSSKNETATIGEDELPWKDIFEACEHGGGTEWYIVEHESDPVSPINAIKKCLEGLKQMGKL
ncbi:MAG: sugar phosphate isomerase/epimerase [bacterium]